VWTGDDDPWGDAAQLTGKRDARFQLAIGRAANDGVVSGATTSEVNVADGGVVDKLLGVLNPCIL
jgi:hypothetical protein